MKLCCFTNLFLLAIICAPFVFLDSSNAATRIQRNVSDNTASGGDERAEYGVGEMLSDDSVPGRQEGDNVLLTGTGPINLTILSGRTLQFQVCEHACAGKSWVCYESTNGFTGGHAAGSCSSISSTCEFIVDGEKDVDAIWFGEMIVFRVQIQRKCIPITMHYKFAEVLQNQDFESCDPKIDPVEKMIKLHAYVVSSCPITVLNAKIHVPKIHTTLLPQASPKPKDTSPVSPSEAKESTAAADAGFPWWAYLIIAAVCVLALIVIGVIVYFVCFKKQKSSKAHPQPVTVVTPKATTKVKVATPDVQPPTCAAPPAAETKDTPSSTRKEDLNFTKFEQSKKSKKVQKKAKKETTTQEPTTTEDALPAPGSRQPVFDLSNAPEPVYRPVPYLKPQFLVPRSMKSAKTDSLEKTLPKEKKEMIESVPDSVARHCLKSSESDLVQEMKSNYPEIKRAVLDVETELLGLPVSQMFVKINAIARESKRKLSAAGCKFDERRCITFVPESARQILQNEKTAATTVYFAFGAEYHQHVKCDKLTFYSLPLLMVIALQKRFESRDRRKACALIRRKMPIVLANNTEAARQKMPYPMNAIEKAYCKDPLPFRQLSEIKTDSESERRIKEMKEAAAAAEKKETVPGGGHDAKRKKKSAKKRH